LTGAISSHSHDISGEIIQDIVGAMIGTLTGISVSYDDDTGLISFDAQTAGDARYPLKDGVSKISVSASPPGSPAVGDLWIDPQARTAGRSNYNLGKLIDLYIDLMTSFSTTPLKPRPNIAVLTAR